MFCFPSGDARASRSGRPTKWKNDCATVATALAHNLRRMPVAIAGFQNHHYLSKGQDDSGALQRPTLLKNLCGGCHITMTPRVRKARKPRNAKREHRNPICSCSRQMSVPKKVAKESPTNSSKDWNLWRLDPSNYSDDILIRTSSSSLAPITRHRNSGTEPLSASRRFIHPRRVSSRMSKAGGGPKTEPKTKSNRPTPKRQPNQRRRKDFPVIVRPRPLNRR